MSPAAAAPRADLLFVSESRGAWGAQISESLLARELVAAGLDVRLLCRSEEFAALWPGPAEVLAGFAYWRRLITSAMRSRTVVCGSYGLLPAFWLLRLVPRRPRLVLDMHVVFSTDRGRRKLRLLATPADLVIPVSRLAAGQLGPRQRVAVVYRPVDAAPSAAPRGDGRTVGVVGRIDEDKRLELVIAAVARLDDVVLVVRGSALKTGGYADEIRREAERALGDRVRFEGRVEQRHAMDGLDCLVVANPAETMGRTVVEAQLAGVPAVVPDSGGPAELVDPGRTGFTYAAGDVDALAAAIRTALDTGGSVVEPARAAALARHAPAEVARSFADHALGRSG